MNSNVNEDDEKILNPLKPQKNFGKKSKNKKKLGKISSITVVQNNKNKGKPKANPWFNKNDKNEKELRNKV